MCAKEIETGIDELVDAIKTDRSIRAVGMSGGERPFPEPGEGDIDLFVYCNEIPGKSQRYELLSVVHESIEPISIGCLEGGHWGQGDRCYVAGVETWLLYFTVTEARAELEDILTGKYPGRVDNYYYPLGRCAMWKTMRAFYDPDGILQSFKTRLEEYPVELAKTVVDHHLAALKDVEDLERAVQRKDVFFYHFALDLALDHFLQILFAINKTYFPSRKRSGQYIQGFHFKPVDCEQRLHRAIAWGGEANTLGESFAVWQDLVQDLEQLISINHGDSYGEK
jgi:hypothetical protein